MIYESAMNGSKLLIPLSLAKLTRVTTRILIRSVIGAIEVVNEHFNASKDTKAELGSTGEYQTSNFQRRRKEILISESFSSSGFAAFWWASRAFGR